MMTTLSQFPRLLRTASHLRFSQLSYRVGRLVKRRLDQVFPTDHNPASLEVSASLADTLPVVPLPATTSGTGDDLVALLGRGELRHLNQTAEIGSAKTDWRLGPQRRDRLWAITLHYHEWLFELVRIVAASGPDASPLAAAAEHQLSHSLSDWLHNCDLAQPGARDLAWNSYAIATRLGWWARAWHVLPDRFWQDRSELRAAFLASMLRQARHLAANLEWDLRGNHLLRDAVGLAWAGRFFEGDEAARWLAQAAALAIQQADEQTLPDGGHFELSPMYHREVMHDWLSLACLLRDDRAIEKMRDTWQRMAAYAVWLKHPDGTAPQFNDGAMFHVDNGFEPARKFGWTVDAFRPIGGRYFDSSGIVVWHGDPWTVLFDVGEVGAACQPGHAHADTLTLECSYRSQRLFVDPGCFGYDDDDRRAYDRSTAAHNTVCVDGVDSSEMWHIFRVGRRARPVQTRVDFTRDGVAAAASHTGYDHLPGSPRHDRSVRADNRGAFVVRDRVTGRGDHEVAGGFLLAEHWTATPCDSGWLLASAQEKLRVRVSGPSQLQLRTAARAWHPDYGVARTTLRLEWHYAGPLPIEVVVCVEAVELMDLLDSVDTMEVKSNDGNQAALNERSAP